MSPSGVPFYKRNGGEYGPPVTPPRTTHRNMSPSGVPFYKKNSGKIWAISTSTTDQTTRLTALSLSTRETTEKNVSNKSTHLPALSTSTRETVGEKKGHQQLHIPSSTVHFYKKNGGEKKRVTNNSSKD